jgi:nucleotide-binding universal stress UspA family protein
MSISLKRILVPTDFSGSAAQACRVAVKLARLYGAELHVLRVAAFRKGERHDPLAHVADPERVQAELEEVALEDIGQLLDEADTTDLTILPVFRSGISPAPTIVGYAARHDVDMVVMGTHGRRGLNHLMLGSVAEEVVRSAGCPVLTVRASEAPAPVEWKRFLIPMDFSGHSDRAMGTAHQLASDFGAELQLLHVVEPLRSMGISNYGHDICRNWEVSQKEAAEELMHKACEPFGDTAVCTDFKIVSGTPAEAIPAVAAEIGGDLIVIPTHGRTGLKKFLLGSVAERVVRHSSCAVLTLKPFGRSLVDDED